MNELQKSTARAIVNVFETGRILGDYAAVAVIKGDNGHLSYGRSQAALGSGTLYALLQSYCDLPDAKFASELIPYLPRLRQKDVTLDADSALKDVLRQAGRDDPRMRDAQDHFFDRNYLLPACAAADAIGVVEPLGQTVVYDSYIQGGWAIVRRRTGAPAKGETRSWVKRYIAERRAWLQSLRPPLPSTVYRMDAFEALIKAEKWDLALPVTVGRREINAATLAPPVAPPVTSDGKPVARPLQLTKPYLRGDDVKALQSKLYAQLAIALAPDGTYGPFTDKLVAAWQKSKNIDEQGVREKTRESLKL